MQSNSYAIATTPRQLRSRKVGRSEPSCGDEESEDESYAESGASIEEQL